MDKKPRIAVYAISKNESQFVKRFCESAKDADLIMIADTGSTDGTAEVAAECAARTFRPHAAWVTQLEAVGLPIAIAI